MRVRLDLQSLSTITTQSVQDHATLWDNFLHGIASQHMNVTESASKTYQQVDQRISRVEEMLRAQSPIESQEHYQRRVCHRGENLASEHSIMEEKSGVQDA